MLGRSNLIALPTYWDWSSSLGHMDCHVNECFEIYVLVWHAVMCSVLQPRTVYHVGPLNKRLENIL